MLIEFKGKCNWMQTTTLIQWRSSMYNCTCAVNIFDDMSMKWDEMLGVKLENAAIVDIDCLFSW